MFDWNWSKEDTLIHGDSGTKPSTLICSFDMDGTLIQTKSGAKFAKDAHDWLILNDKVAPKIREYHDKGYKIVIFTNQGGIQKGHTKEGDIKTKIQNIGNLLGVPMQAFIATASDYYHKPSAGMWKYFVKNMNGGVAVVMKDSFYVGDAAGRPKAGTRVKDFSDSDYKFAINIGIGFKTPEMFYHDEKEALPEFEFDPKKTFKKTGSLFKDKNVTAKEVASKSKELIIFVGPPGGGKSTFYKSYLSDYVHVNNDTLKTKQKCIKTAEEAMTAGKSVVIDNTNPDADTRKTYIELAKKHNYPSRCFLFDVTKDMAFHLNELRKANNQRKHSSNSVADVIIHTWFKRLQKPTKAEGFTEVEVIEPIAGPFVNPEDEEIFFSHVVS